MRERCTSSLAFVSVVPLLDVTFLMEIHALKVAFFISEIQLSHNYRYIADILLGDILEKKWSCTECYAHIRFFFNCRLAGLRMN